MPKESRKPDKLKTARTVTALRHHISVWRRDTETVGLIPTMGALHTGHISLVESALALSDHVVVSLFVNPAQFEYQDEYTTYPRAEADDAAKLHALGVELLYAPDVAEMYPAEFASTIRVGGLTEGLCGAHRPGHFEGVATVVAKLLIQCMPDVAFFGEKDYQQLQVIKRLVRDLNIPVRIEGVPTVREADGLACSSRNAHLSDAERRLAPALYRVLTTIAERLELAAGAPREELAWGLDELRRSGFTRVDYLELCDAVTLARIDTVAAPARILAAVWLGETRLIDNLAVAPRLRLAEYDEVYTTTSRSLDGAGE